MTASAPASQTLSRGISILEILAAHPNALSIEQIAEHLGVHRSIAYRLLRTLEHHGLVERDSSGMAALGPQLAALAAGVARDLQSEALPELTSLANELGMTAFLAVLDHDECITLASVEPRHAVASVAQRPGTRHPVTVGAPGKAILVQLPPADWVDAATEHLRGEVEATRDLGYATSSNEVIPSLRSIAVPLAIRGRNPAAIAVVYVATPHGLTDIAARLQRSAVVIATALGHTDPQLGT